MFENIEKIVSPLLELFLNPLCVRKFPISTPVADITNQVHLLGNSGNFHNYVPHSNPSKPDSRLEMAVITEHTCHPASRYYEVI